MQMLRSTETKFELPAEIRVDRSTYERELELIGRRLDAVRSILKNVGKSKKYAWVRTHWQETEAYLLKKWETALYRLQSGIVEVRSHNHRPYKIDYDFWEGTEELDAQLAQGWINQYFDPADLQARLNESWERAKEDLLKKARQGLM